ncbi:hypothetical protein Asppvi_007346 [Aspergillus pseudoviridinutans]|uniref:COP9 signalosome complex subunit 3 N-terminal helical repeats domain-containing protein n=1 Tax=Aspergillus pseudoviridinutans TaxID=1517512 RepID=A0A9P3BBY0_9EURO|nr:uncharacterized protein Asppvi_007346 [Aspergillus pseudoviridinutans]GIJ88422.1 hypothetical protein Asppvi_007346 [Aspergillus pseudoviridinutans]
MTEILSRLTVVSSLQHASNEEDYDRQLYELIAYIKQPTRLNEITRSADLLLDGLNPSLHSVAYLFVFHARVKVLGERLPKDVQPGGHLWKRAIEFLRVFDPIQVRYAGQEWRRLIELVANAAQASSKTFLAVQAVRDAILRLDPASETFTSTHLLLMKLCLLSRSYRHALPVLNKAMYHFPAGPSHAYQAHRQVFLCSEHGSSAAYITHASGFTAQVTYRDHLQYFLYGAMIYMALKEWESALHLLCIVVSCPVANTVSKIMVEAYKKWLLVSLLAKGKIISTPEMINPHVMKVYQSLILPYVSLADTFENDDTERLWAEVDVGRAIWLADNNMGLVLQVVHAHRKSVVVKLGSTFSAVAIADIAQRIASDPVPSTEAETSISSMVISGLDSTLLHSNSNHKPTMLHFHAGGASNSFGEEHIAFLLDSERLLLSTLAANLGQSNHDLELSSEHLQFLRRAKNASQHSSGQFGMKFKDDISSWDVDEDIMSGLH